MGAAVSSGGLRGAAAARNVPSISLSLAPPRLGAVQAHARLNSVFLSRVPLRDMHADAGGGQAPPNSTATSVAPRAGPEAAAGVPAAAAGAEGGTATSEEPSDPAVERCDAPAPVELLTLIVEEESPEKRHRLGRVLKGILTDQSGLASLRKDIELLHERLQPLLRDKETATAPVQPPRVGKEESRSQLNPGDAEEETAPADAPDAAADENGHLPTPPGDADESDDGRYAAYKGYAQSTDLDDDDANSWCLSIKLRGAEELDADTRRYNDFVRIRNYWERVRPGSTSGGGPVCFMKGWTLRRRILEDFEAREIPDIRRGHVSRRDGWRQFLLATPTLRSCLEHHAQWGPDVNVQADEILRLWAVPLEPWARPESDDVRARLRWGVEWIYVKAHFDVGPLTGAQVAAVGCLGAYRRLMYVAVGEGGAAGSFRGRDVDACACAYCLATPPDRRRTSIWEALS